MKKIILFCLLFILPSLRLHSQVKVFDTQISAGDIQSHIDFLAGDKLKGRLTGTPECDEAADYIKEHFIQFGLKPIPGKEFYQSYSFISDMQPASGSELVLKTGREIIRTGSTDFNLQAFSGSGSFAGEIVFAGYGIDAPKLKYNDYENLDVKGKFVLVLRYHPEYDNPHSEFDEYSSFRFKANTAKEKGAKGILFVNGIYPKLAEDKLPEFKYDKAPSMKDFAAVNLKRSTAEKLIGNSFSIAAVQDSISKSKKPLSSVLSASVKNLSVRIDPVEKNGRNVIGLLEGNDPVLKNEYIVVGAHYDHLGMGVDGSLYRGTEPMVHHGADDNASGTAGVLELAQKFAAEKNNKRSILFICFSGEELGLLGSGYYVNNPLVPNEKSAAMFNLDMVGRLNEEKSLIVYGTGTSLLWKKIVDSLNAPYGFKITKNDEGYGPSDHSSFYGKNIPVLFFFTGTHPDYHRPTDVAEKINAKGEEQIVKYVAGIIESAADMPARPDYVNVPRKSGEKTGGWKVYVGTIPDYAYQGEGLKITGVSENSPAKKAGLKGGDIVMKFGNKKLSNIYDYVYALKNYVPGDVVDVEVLRGTETLKFKVELGAR